MRRPARRTWAVGLGAGALAVTAVVARPARPAHHQATVATVIAARPGAVRTLSVRSGDRTVGFARSDVGRWKAEAGTPGLSAGLLESMEGQVLPLQAYKAVMTDAVRPEFGLVAPEITLDVEPRTGAAVEVAFGAASFSGGGYYARRAGDPRLFLVPRQTMDNLRSLLAGHAYSSPNPINDKLARIGEDQEKAADGPRIGPYLRQVLESGIRPPEGVE